MGGPAPERLTSRRALLGGPALAFGAGAAIAAFVLVAGDGWEYYTTPLRVRGYHEAHRLLRPAGLGGHSLGIAGTLVLLCTLAYLARKNLRFLQKAGTVPRWLEVHVFFGVFGPLLITLHTSFKFNGLISVAFWSMALVLGSGFIGRSLYVRIPKTIRGHELSRGEVEERIAQLKESLHDAEVPAAIHERLDVLAQIGHAAADAAAPASWREVSHLRSDMLAAGVDTRLASELLALARERAQLLRSISSLERRRRLFQIWHVFHRPLVWVMFGILSLHVAVALYFGYMPFG